MWERHVATPRRELSSRGSCFIRWEINEPCWVGNWSMRRKKVVLLILRQFSITLGGIEVFVLREIFNSTLDLAPTSFLHVLMINFDLFNLDREHHTIHQAELIICCIHKQSDAESVTLFLNFSYQWICIDQFSWAPACALKIRICFFLLEKYAN